MALGPVGQIHISVTDLGRSAFYRDVLGIPLLFVVPGQPMAFFASGIDAEHKRLTGLGVHFPDMPHVVHPDGGSELWMSGFTDPDGHQLLLMQEKS